METVKEWVTLLLALLNTFMILFGIIKVFNRHELEWLQKEQRLASVESKVAMMEKLSLEIVKANTKLEELCGEMERIRDRLDKFLDKNE